MEHFLQAVVVFVPVDELSVEQWESAVNAVVNGSAQVPLGDVVVIFGAMVIAVKAFDLLVNVLSAWRWNHSKQEAAMAKTITLDHQTIVVSRITGWRAYAWGTVTDGSGVSHEAWRTDVWVDGGDDSFELAGDHRAALQAAVDGASP